MSLTELIGLVNENTLNIPSGRRGFLAGAGTTFLAACDIFGGGDGPAPTTTPTPTPIPTPTDNLPELTFLETSQDNWDKLYTTISASDDNGLSRLDLVFDLELGVNPLSIGVSGIPNPANQEILEVDIINSPDTALKAGFYSGEGKLYDSADQVHSNGTLRFNFSVLSYQHQTSIRKTLDELVQTSPIVETISKTDWNSIYNLKGIFSTSLDNYLNEVVIGTAVRETVKNIRILGTNETDIRLLVEYEILQDGQVIGRNVGETYHAEIELRKDGGLGIDDEQELFNEFIRDKPPELTFLETSTDKGILSVTYSASDDNDLSRLDLVFDSNLGVNTIPLNISTKPNPADKETVDKDISSLKTGFYAGEGKLYDSASQPHENSTNRFTFTKLNSEYAYQKSINQTLDGLVDTDPIVETISKQDWDTYNVKELFSNTTVKTYLDNIIRNTATYETVKNTRVLGNDATNMRLLVEYQVTADNKVIGRNNGDTYFAEVSLDTDDKQGLYDNFIKVAEDSRDADGFPQAGTEAITAMGIALEALKNIKGYTYDQAPYFFPNVSVSQGVSLGGGSTFTLFYDAVINKEGISIVNEAYIDFTEEEFGNPGTVQFLKNENTAIGIPHLIFNPADTAQPVTRYKILKDSFNFINNNI